MRLVSAKVVGNVGYPTTCAEKYGVPISPTWGIGKIPTLLYNLMILLNLISRFISSTVTTFVMLPNA